MARVRYWCATCAEIKVDPMVDACRAVGHRLNAVGIDAAVEVVVASRRLDMDPERFGYYNMVGHAEGRDAFDQEAVTRARIEEMRKQDQATKREHRINSKLRDNPRRVGAIPSALLFSLKRQYGSDYLQKAEELMRSQGCWWGD